MSYDAEAQIARELMTFAATDQLYRGSKPVLWSVVERTALAEAEVEYHEHTSTTVWVKFPLFQMQGGGATMASDLLNASVLIWTTTPWTLPANRAIAYSPDIAYGLYTVMEAPADNWAAVGDLYVIADKLSPEVMKAARVDRYERLRAVDPATIATCAHPLRGQGYDFAVPLLPAAYVTDDAGTGFVHTAPGHGADDYATYVAHRESFAACGTPEVPHVVGPDGAYLPEVPLFAGARVLDDRGREGDANARVIAALVAAGKLVARGRLTHSYPHSWRSKAPLIFRNTPQWFIALDRPVPHLDGRTLREVALAEIARVRWVPASGENRIGDMIRNKPDWVVSRQRAWGVPIPIFVHRGTNGILVDERVNARILDAFGAEGGDAWFTDPDGARFLAPEHDPADYEKIGDVLEVWFDSGSTHAFTLERRDDLKVRRAHEGGRDTVMYLEGSDQHRGWFNSSLVESCGTRGRAPYDVVLTHGFILDEAAEKMSKSKGNVISPQDVMRDFGADILRLWVAASDTADDVRFGPEVLKTFVETYRKLRNTIRWMLGALAHHDGATIGDPAVLPDLERFMLHRLAELGEAVPAAYAAFDYKRVVALLSAFMTTDLSAFYFDVRKDVLYCDPPSSATRRAALAVIDETFRRLSLWLAPVLAFTAEEAWQQRFPSADGSVHLELFPETPVTWRDDALAERWALIRRVRRVVTGALEVERAAKRIGASLEAAPVVHVTDEALRAALRGVDFAEVCITSDIRVEAGEGPADAFRLDEVPGVAVVPQRAAGRKCARSWKVSPLVGADPDHPDVTPRDAQALREWEAARAA